MTRCIVDLYGLGEKYSKVTYENESRCLTRNTLLQYPVNNPY